MNEPADDEKKKSRIFIPGEGEEGEENAPAPGLESYQANDAGRARLFVDRHAADIRYVPKFCSWYLWGDHRWSKDEDGGITRLAIEHARRRVLEAYDIKESQHRQIALRSAVTLGEMPVIHRMLESAKVDRRLVASHETLDADPYLLGVGNGVVDLRNGSFREGRREDMITKRAGTDYVKGATCPRWLAFLQEIFGGDEMLIAYIQRFVGYALTGDVSEQCFQFYYGSGKNGKSVLTEILHLLLGDYGQRASAVLLTACNNGHEPHNEIARLHGARLVIGSETEEGARLAESRVKDLTGGDTLVGRRLYEEAFEFKPVLKLIIFGNHKPAIRGTDAGIWRRVRLIPFNVQIPEEKRDPQLSAKLAAELPGILNWALEGAAAWRAGGLKAPASIVRASEDYQEEEDTLGDFISSKLELEPDGRVTSAELFACYVRWAEETGQNYVMTQQMLGRRLGERRHFERLKSNGQTYWKGVVLK